MFYDLSVSAGFKDIEKLRDPHTQGYCVCYTAATVEAALAESPVLPKVEGVSLYTRVDISYSTGLDSFSMKSLRKKYDVVCIAMDSLTPLPTITKLEPDLIRLPLSELRHTRKSLGGTLQTANIFIELQIREALYRSRVPWLNMLRRLLRFGCRRRIILSSGAQGPTELRNGLDIERILAVLNIRPNISQQMLENTRNLLENAAIKRYTVDGAVATNENEGALKEDFIIKQIRNQTG